MRASGAITRLSIRRLQEALQAGSVEIVEEGAVVQDRTMRSALRISRNFPVVQCQIAIPFAAQLRHGKRPPDTAHHPVEAVTNISPFRIPIERQHKRVVQAAWTEQHGATARAAAQDRNAAAAAIGEMDIAVRLPGLPQYDALARTLPHPQHTLTRSEEFFVEMETLARIGQSCV